MIEWRQVPSYPWLEVSSEGCIRRVIKGRNGWRPHQIAGSMWPEGYLMVTTQNGGKRIKIGAHVLVCEAFHGPRPSEDHEVAHADGMPTNNAADNLRWATPKANADDRRKHGRDPIGERHGMAKLKEADVFEIFRLKRRGLTGKQISAIYGINRHHINKIASGKVWGHLRRAAS